MQVAAQSSYVHIPIVVYARRSRSMLASSCHCVPLIHTTSSPTPISDKPDFDCLPFRGAVQIGDSFLNYRCVFEQRGVRDDSI
jgi:hypothetical protein